MDDFTAAQICINCGRAYEIALQRMRANLEFPCSCCGFGNTISETRAIEAHRLFEQLIFEKHLSHAQAA